MKSTKLFSIFLLFIPFSSSQYYLETKSCAMFFSSENFRGDNFTLNDGDQSISLEEDHRAPNSGWNLTRSLRIHSGCTLDICNDTYFDGACQPVAQGRYSSMTSLNLTDLASASCTCQKECKCSKIYMKQNSCARAYLTGGCKTCNTPYTDLVGEQDAFPEEFVGKVEAFRLRRGCELTLYEEVDFDGKATIIERQTVEDFFDTFKSYSCKCDESQFEPRRKPTRPSSLPPLVKIPEKLDDVIKMLSDKEYANHPALRAAFMSLKAGRSSRNAYILLLGSTGAGKSSAINLLFDNPNVTKVGDAISTTTDIHEFRIPVPIDEIGVANSELRVIDTPGLGDTRGIQQDAKFLATLDAYLANHEELKDRLPNIVLIFHKFNDNRYKGEGSNFVKMLRGLDSFRERITDENYSNVIFVMSHYCSVLKAMQKRPDARLADMKSVIENYSLFPKPIIMTVAENKAVDAELPMVNGYYRLPNGEYYPKNLFEKLELVTEKSSDLIGLGVFRSAFRDSTDFNVTSSTFSLMEGSPNIEKYFQIIANAFFSINKTEVSQILQSAWDEKLNSDMKKRFPGSLPYLQKALSLRNVNIKEDVPKTSTGILELLTAIRHDEATRELLKKGLNIQAPNFPQNTVAGQSYNVFKDMALSTSPFDMSTLHGSDIGFMIPKVISSKLDPSESQNFQLFDTREEYISSRLKSLGIDGTIGNGSFKGTVKPGHNIAEISFKENSCVLSSTREIRVFEFVLNDKPSLTPEFRETVKNLPPFAESDHDSVQKWTSFFNNYGTHVVKSVHGGGAIQIRLESNKKFDSNLIQALYDLVQFAEDMSFMVMSSEGESGNGTKTKTVIPSGITHSLTFLGGDPAYHTNDLTKMSVEKASKLLTNWKKSLKFNPSVLTTEMRLMPISRVARELGQNISAEIEKATGLLFNSELKYVKPKQDANIVVREETVKMDEVLKDRAQANEAIMQLTLELKKMELQVQLKDQELRNMTIHFEKEKQEMDNRFQLEMKRMEEASAASARDWEMRRDQLQMEAQANMTMQQNTFDAEQNRLKQERDNQFQLEMRKMEEAAEKEKREFEIETARLQAEAEANRLKQQNLFDLEKQKLQDDMKRREWEWKQKMAARPVEQPTHKPSTWTRIRDGLLGAAFKLFG